MAKEKSSGRGSGSQRDENEVGQVWNFKGKYADFMRDLYKPDGDDYKAIFDTIYHGYAFCAMYGLLKGRRHIYDSQQDNPNDSQNLGFRWTSADPAGVFSYDMLRKYVLLYSKASNESFETKIDRALRYDFTTNDVFDPELKSKSKYKENSDIIDEYVLGGLELIHAKIMEMSSREALIDFMNDTIQEFKKVASELRKERITCYD